VLMIRRRWFWFGARSITGVLAVLLSHLRWGTVSQSRLGELAGIVLGW
jgi:hypothetical protein